MSDINSNAIDALYPIAGKDNNSQGFRDNFAAIKDALATAKAEITDLQEHAVLVGQLGVEQETPTTSDLNTSIIQNGAFKQFSPVFNDRGTSTSTTTINVDNGPVQKFTVSDGHEFNFSWGNWASDTERCASVRLLFKTASGSGTISFSGTIDLETEEISGTVVPESNVSLPLAVNSTSFVVVEAWTYDEGDHIYIHNIGTF